MDKRRRTAVFLVGLMGLLSIACAHVMTNIRADAWLQNTVVQLAKYRSANSLSQLDGVSKLVVNRSKDRLSKTLWMSTGAQDANPIQLDMAQASARDWGYAWIAGQNGDSVYATAEHSFFLDRQGSRVQVDRASPRADACAGAVREGTEQGGRREALAEWQEG